MAAWQQRAGAHEGLNVRPAGVHRRALLTGIVAAVLTGGPGLPAGAAEPATPKVAALDYGRNETPDKQALLARFGLVILGMTPSMGMARMKAVVAGIKMRNPDALLAQYSVLNEMQSSPRHNEDAHPMASVLERQSWWLRDRAGRRVQWTPAYGNDEANLTDWALPDAEGRRWPQWKAERDAQTYFLQLPQLDFVFLDNVMHPRVNADWKGTGSNQSRTDPEVLSAVRRGYVAYWTRLRELRPGLKVIGNVDNDLDAPEWKGQLEGAFLEGMMGRRYSLVHRGWSTMMERYRAVTRNTAAPHLVIFQVYGRPDDHALMRYGLASALLEDGYYAYSTDDRNTPAPWFDEYSASIGAAVGSPPKAPAPSGIWMRRYANGLVLVNPQAFAASIDVGPGWRRLAGTQDPDVNSGQPARVVTLGAGEGLLLRR